jgi:putative endonuclease
MDTPHESTRAIGKSSEDLAADHLTTLGYAIVARNWQAKDGELDIIARAPDGTLVFVEVKSARRPGFGHPFQFVTRGKQRKIITMARRYLYENDMNNKPCRFDVIAVLNGKIEHLKNAFLV